MAYDHSKHKIRYDNVVEDRITDMQFPDGITGRTKFWGTSVTPTDESDGRYEPGEGSVTMQREAWEDYISRTGDGYLQKEWEAVIEREDRAKGRYFKTELLGCKFLAPDDGTAEGGEPTTVTVGFTFMQKIENGNRPVI